MDGSRGNHFHLDNDSPPTLGAHHVDPHHETRWDTIE